MGIFSDSVDDVVGTNDASIKLATGIDNHPDRAASAVQQSRRYNIPPSLIGTTPDPNLERQAKLEDASSHVESSPTLKSWLSQQPLPVVSMVSDDTENLSTLSTVINESAKSARALISGVPRISQGIYGGLAMGVGAIRSAADVISGENAFLPLLPVNPFAAPEEFLLSIAKNQSELADYVAGSQQGANVVQSGLYSGFSSLGQNLPLFGAAVITGQPELALAVMTTTVAGQEYQKAREQIGSAQAFNYAAGQAAVEFLTEKIPVSKLLKDINNNTGIVKTLATQAAAEIPGEQIATILQDLNEWANLSPDKTFKDYLAERPSAAAETLIATIVGVGGNVAVTKGISALVNRSDQANTAQTHGKLLADLSQLASASKVRERDIQTFEGFLQTATENGDLEAVYIDGKVLLDSGLAGQLAAASPTVAEQIPQAQAGTMVRIPTSEVMGRFNQELAPLLPEMRTDPNGMTQKEAEQFVQERGETLRTEVEKILTQTETDQAAVQSRKNVYDTVLNELTATGRMTKPVAENYSLLTSTFYHVMGQRMGKTAEQLFGEERLRIAGEGQGELAQAKTITPDQRDLIIQHNLSAENLLHAIRMGGLPVPSLAVTKAKHPLTNFGEITLLGSESMANPKGYASTKVYGGDIYSPRYPDITYSLDKASLKKLNEILAPYSGEGKREIYSSDVQSIQDLTQTDAFRSYMLAKTGKTSVWDLSYSEMEPEAARMLRESGAKEKIFQGFTNIGNRKYIEHSLANVVKILKKELRGGENFNYGVGSIRAKFTPQFKTIEQIRKAKNKLIDKTTFEKIKDEVDNEFFSIAEKLGQYHGESQRFGFADIVSGMMRDAATIGIPRSLLENQFKNVPNEVQKDIAEYLNKLRNLPTEYFEAKILRDVDLAEFSGAVVPIGTSNEVINALKDRGIKDIKFYEQGNEADRVAKIGQFENLLFQEAKGSFSPNELMIRLTKAQDLSTYLHESGHFFLHMLVRLAQRPDAPADIKTDAETALKYMGVEATADTDIFETWQLMSIDEQRFGHEKFARAFEVYLEEGKAPSVALQPVFAKFRSWLINVYKALMDKAKSISGRGMPFGQVMQAQLNDEVRAVFDRMLATQDEIENAQAVRSMGMQFTTEEEAAQFGIDWKTYQAQGEAATQEAISDLDKRRLQDMKWLANARSRLLKQIQKEAKEIRTGVRMRARSEIMSQPVYRAWQFLTAPLTDADRGRWVKAVKVDSVDPEEDSLLTAIAKLGGLRIADIESLWGFDPADMNAASSYTGLGMGKPPFRRKDGLSLEAMAERLADLGYIDIDEHGKHVLEDMHDKVENSLHGRDQYSFAANWTLIQEGPQAQQLEIDPETGLPVVYAGRFNAELISVVMASDPEISGSDAVAKLTKLGMVRKSGGDHPDSIAEAYGFTSGQELIRAILGATAPHEAIEVKTDELMLQEHSDLATPKSREDAVNRSLATEAHARMQETELAALEKAVNAKAKNAAGKMQSTLPAAAKQFANAVIARLKVKDIRPGQFTGSASRAGLASKKAAKTGNLSEAALEKRNQVVNTYAARYASDALDEVDRGVAYLRKFENDGTRKNLDTDYLDQIDAILERYDLRRVSNKELSKRKSLADWVAEQEANGISPDLPSYISDAGQRVNYKELTVEEFRGLIDSIKQIEHFARLKKKLLLAKDKREFAAIVTEINNSIAANAGKRVADNVTRSDVGSLIMRGLKMFTAAHRKMASLVFQMDGFKDGGPLWNALVRTANEQGNWEATKQAELTKSLAVLLKALPKTDKPFTKGQFFKKVNMSLTQEMRLTIALNWGNEGNRQRLMDGRNWTFDAVQEVLDSLNKEEWDFVQGVWDTFESLRPAIAEKEKRVMGKEPDWVQPASVATKFGTLKGGYFPIVYDPFASRKAQEQEEAEAIKRQLQGARSAATTRRNFIKSRAEEVKGRPVLLTMDGMFRGLTDVVHDLAYHEWLIDANRLMRSIDEEVRSRYGAETVTQLRNAIDAIAAGEATKPYPLDGITRHFRMGSMVAGLGLNITNALLQPLGLTQSIVRIGGKWVAQGVYDMARNPVSTTKTILEKSEFMRNRKRTQNRELNDLRNRLRGKGELRQSIDAMLFMPMTAIQTATDLPTWWGAYQKSLAEGHDDDKAVQIADQAVIASQGGGQIKDLAAIQRGPEMAKLFTVFYGYFSTAYNLGAERANATNFRNPMQVFKLATDFLLLYSVPAVLGVLLKNAFSAGGDDDDEELANKLEREQISYLFGTMVGVREFTGAAQLLLGTETKFGTSYGGPAGLRFLQEVYKFSQQASQGEMDRAFVRAGINVLGVATHLPSAQINRTLDGIIAISEGQTQNPIALMGGVSQ